MNSLESALLQHRIGKTLAQRLLPVHTRSVGSSYLISPCRARTLLLLLGATLSLTSTLRQLLPRPVHGLLGLLPFRCAEAMPQVMLQLLVLEGVTQLVSNCLCDL